MSKFDEHNYEKIDEQIYFEEIGEKIDEVKESGEMRNIVSTDEGIGE